MTRNIDFSIITIVSCFVLSLIASTLGITSLAYAAEPTAGQRLITIHDRGLEKSLISSRDTLREIFSEHHILLDPNDVVEPGLDEELPGNNYQVNVYRAKPITVVDGMSRIRVMSAHQTPKEIAKDAGVTLHDEDDTTMALPQNVVQDGMSLEMVIDRATPIKLVLYGKRDTVYTQTTNVEDFLKEKKIVLGKKDTLSVKPSAAIKDGMKIEIWRNGKQTITKKETIPFEVEQIQDTERKVGYKKVKTPGVNGKKKVTYEIVMKNGKQVRRKVIQTVVITEPKKQVEIVGAKPSFGGDFAAALAKLRSCEGGYTSWNPAGPYYGAYQFDQGTWSSVSSAKYGDATPAEQDAAARKLYERRGWSPWPVCGASLPDTYR